MLPLDGSTSCSPAGVCEFGVSPVRVIDEATLVTARGDERALGEFSRSLLYRSFAQLRAARGTTNHGPHGMAALPQRGCDAFGEERALSDEAMPAVMAAPAQADAEREV